MRNNVPKTRIIVFTRYPEPGTTKTRLIPSLGPEGAAELQHRMTVQVLNTCRQYAAQHRDTKIEIRYEGGDDTLMTESFGTGDYRAQPTGHLGERLSVSFQQAFNEGADRVVIIGSDCPDISPEIQAQAFTALSDHDLIIGPAMDGGYYLIGLKAPQPELFTASIPWGTSAVRELTLKAANAQGLSVSQLEPLNDVDVPEDIARLRNSPLLEGFALPTLSIIIPTLNEADYIERTIDSAQQNGVEIIVADSGSNDDTVKQAKKKAVRIIECNPGRAQQMNTGAQVALGDILLFLHADTQLPPSFVNEVQETLAIPNTAAGAFHLSIDTTDRATQRIARWTNRRSQWFQLPYGDQALFLKRERFEQLGGFPHLPIMEDFALVRTLRHHGRIRLAPSAVTTSDRRWHKLGPNRTLFVNIIMVAGYFLGVSPEKLARFYQRQGSMK